MAKELESDDNGHDDKSDACVDCDAQEKRFNDELVTQVAQASVAEGPACLVHGVADRGDDPEHSSANEPDRECSHDCPILTWVSPVDTSWRSEMPPTRMGRPAGLCPTSDRGFVFSVTEPLSSRMAVPCTRSARKRSRRASPSATLSLVGTSWRTAPTPTWARSGGPLGARTAAPSGPGTAAATVTGSAPRAALWDCWRRTRPTLVVGPPPTLSRTNGGSSRCFPAWDPLDPSLHLIQ